MPGAPVDPLESASAETCADKRHSAYARATLWIMQGTLTQTELLESIDKKLSLLVALATFEKLPAGSKAGSRPIEVVLRDGGFSQSDTAKLMGVSSQAVQQVISKYDKGGSSAKKSK